MSRTFLDLINPQIEFASRSRKIFKVVSLLPTHNATASKMVIKAVIATLAFLHFVECEWVKLPSITAAPKVSYKIQTVASFADMPSSSVLASSELISSMFSTEKPKMVSFMMATTAPRPSSTNKLMQTVVTSKTLNFKDEDVKSTTDRTDSSELELVKLVPVSSSKVKKVVFLNQTTSLQVLPSFVADATDSPKPPIVQATLQFSHDDEDDDGVTILSENESLSSNEEVYDSGEYYEDDEPAMEPKTTTKAPRKVSLRKPKTPQPQKRIIEAAGTKPNMHSHLSFTNFLKFLKNIQDSFTSRTAKTINDKIKMLREFRDNLMLTINSRINSLWKTQSRRKKINKHNRLKRTLGGGGGWMDQHGGGGMDFPSAEGALLSISFLTFAVFLIKLVLVRFTFDAKVL